MLQRYLLFWLVLLSAMAFLSVDLLSPAANPFLLTGQKYCMWGLIAVTMFAIGWMLPRDEVAQVARRWPVVLAGTGLQYLSMPLLAFLVVKITGAGGALATGIIVVGCVPGAMASNVLTLLARGNVSYSLSLTTLATLLSPLMVPLALWLFLKSNTVEVDRLGIMINLVVTVVIPVVAGHLLGRLTPQWESRAKAIGSTVANLAILWIIAVVVAKNHENITGLASDWRASLTLIGSLLAINLLGYTIGYSGSSALRLPEPMRRAMTLEIGMQNAGLGAVLAGANFTDQAALPPALYTFGCMLTGTILAKWWAGK